MDLIQTQTYTWWVYVVGCALSSIQFWNKHQQNKRKSMNEFKDADADDEQSLLILKAKL